MPALHPLASTLHSALDKVTRPIMKMVGFYEPRIITDWPEIVGDTLAKFSTPIKLRFPQGKTNGGVLHIVVYHAGFATELSHLKPYIIEKISYYFGYKAVNDFKIILRPGIITAELNSTVRTISQLRIAATAPIDDLQKRIEAIIHDESLAKILASLGRHIREAAQINNKPPIKPANNNGGGARGV